MNTTGQVSLIEIVTEIYRHKIKVILASSMLLIIAVIFTLQLPNNYTSKVLLVSAGDDQGGLASLAKNFGGLAGLAGIGLGQSAGTDKSLIGLEILKSQKFITDFVVRHDLTVPLMASEGSKAVTYELIIDDELYDVKTNSWVREVKPPKTIEPTPQEIHERFMELLSIEQDAKTGFITISLEFYSPIMTKKWIDLLVYDLNNKMKLDDKVEAKESIEYLNDILLATKNNNMKETFYQLLEEQTKTLMLTESRSEYIFKTISPSVVPEKKSSPHRAVICIFAAFLGGFITVVIVLIRYFAKANK